MTHFWFVGAFDLGGSVPAKTVRTVVLPRVPPATTAALLDATNFIKPRRVNFTTPSGTSKSTELRRHNKLHFHVFMSLTALDRTLDRVLAGRGRSNDREVIAALFELQIPALVLQRIDCYAVDRTVFSPFLALLCDHVKLYDLSGLYGNYWLFLPSHFESVVIASDHFHSFGRLRPSDASCQKESNDC